MKKSGFTTLALNVPYPKNDPHKSLQIPLYESVAFEFDSAEQIEANFKGEYVAHTYSRASSPTVEYFELKLKTLTQSNGVLAVSSGMAAISNTILAISKSGDNIISGSQLFGHTLSLFQQTLPDFGIDVRFSDLKDSGKLEELIDKNTRAIYFETVTNPQLEIADIEMLSEISRKYGIVLISDSTVTPPNVFNAGKLGINIEVFSATKHISGGTAFGGVVIDHGNYDWRLNPNFKDFIEKFKDNAFIAKLRKNIYRNTGGSMAPQTAKFLIQGLDILELRVEKCYQNCLALGKFLSSNQKVKKVGYPGLEADSRNFLAKKYFSGIPGTIMTFDLESKEACFAFMNKLQIVRRATNLNDNKTLIIHPHSTIYAEFSEEERKIADVRDTMMRLSVGIENVEDLISDIKQALS
ncbi:aminotransferase class I/II-fold pyridoxal phosphate-dependent enzyme [Maribellus comscasis]|uniref:Aminotransferase class I/II-fold pyridoxal phosphate-dependent enzyme n=1 Tax=Maribellus comscasis TaxID=2681766 RepID=A0A6I6JTS8_9BACT|nr:aminotransferase class I/II-fold pyridoxal phosphate-dependent enzyme [Maribellus comscasis]QGY43567.1 aminotransferase class I/II-fold pyridoxal phosphate-dependent enzyme [Maribellus comscasis]